MESVITDIKHFTVKEVRDLTDSTFVIKLERNGLIFKPGQYIRLGFPGDVQMREYSIYSSEQDDFLEVLLKEIPGGEVSCKLRKVKSGDELNIDGPFGFFQLDEKEVKNRKYLFIASGTGIAPFHSYVKSFPELDYTLLHGVKYGNEAYDRPDYEKGRYILCTSRQNDGDYNGRVTDYLLENPVDKNVLCYLCGNSDMINEAYKILIEQGLSTDNIHTEVYF